MLYLNWMDWEQAQDLDRNLCGRELKSKDIHHTVPKDKHITEIMRAKYGDRSTKLNDPYLKDLVKLSHESLRKKICHEASQIISDHFCALSAIAGLRNSGGGKFRFSNIADELEEAWDGQAFIKTFFVIRAAWDDNPKWILVAERKLMDALCLRYEGDFETSLKSFGCVASIISSEKSRKLREINLAIKRRVGRTISITNITEKKGKRPSCVFLFDSMIKVDVKKVSTLNAIYHKCPDPPEGIKRETNGGVSLFRCEGIFLPNNCFVAARNQFTRTTENKLGDVMGVLEDIDIKTEPTAELDAKDNSKSQKIKREKSKVKSEKKLSSQNDEVTKSTPMDTMSKYEKVRANKIERNNAVLKNLGLISVKEEQKSNDSAWCRNSVESGKKVKRRTGNKIVLTKKDMPQTVSLIKSADKVDTVSKTMLPECEKDCETKYESKKLDEKTIPKSTTNKSLEEMEKFKKELVKVHNDKLKSDVLKVIEDVS